MHFVRHRVEKEEMALHCPPSHDEGAGHLGKQGSCNGRGHSDEYAHGLQGDRDRHGGDGGGHPEHKYVVCLFILHIG